MTRSSTSIFFLNRDIIFWRPNLEGVKIHYGDVQKIGDQRFDVNHWNKFMEVLLRKIAWRNLWRSPKWIRKVVLKFWLFLWHSAKSKTQKKSDSGFSWFYLLSASKSKTEILIQFFDARSASGSCQVIFWHFIRASI